MTGSSHLKEIIIEKLPLFTAVLFLLQPVLDIAGYWQVYFGIPNTATLLVRMILLVSTAAAGFFLSERKRYYIAAAGIFAVHTALHAYACMQRPGGYTAPVTDMVNLVRVYYLPVMTICFITFLKRNRRVLVSIRRSFATVLMIIAIVQTASVVTGTNPYTYPMFYIGVLGWFLWTNSQSAILSMLLPVAAVYSAVRWKKRLLPVIVFTAVGEASLYYLGPRLAFASMIAGGICAGVAVFWTRRKAWKQALAIVLITILFTALYPLSPAHDRAGYSYMENYYEWLRVNEMDIHIGSTAVRSPFSGLPGSADPFVITAYADGPASGTEEVLDPENADKLEELYRSEHLLWSMVERFGRDRVFRIYRYTIDPEILGNVRTAKINFCTLVMEEAGLTSRLFGLNLQDMLFSREDPDGLIVTDNFDVENDFHGIYFLTGITGLILMTVFLAAIGLRALLAVIRRPKTCFTPAMASMGIAFGIAMIHAYFTASMLRHNNASIYLAAVLSSLWYLSGRKEKQKAAGKPDASGTAEAAERAARNTGVQAAQHTGEVQDR